MASAWPAPTHATTDVRRSWSSTPRGTSAATAETTNTQRRSASWFRTRGQSTRKTSNGGTKLTIMCALDDPFPKKMFGTVGFQLGDSIRYLESEPQNTELSLEVAKIQFSLSGL